MAGAGPDARSEGSPVGGTWGMGSGSPASLVLEASGVSKAYGPLEALKAIDLTISRGEIVGLLGPNGAGKSTLISIVAGLLRPDVGTVTVNGIDPARDPVKAQRFVGFAPQSTGVYEPLTVEENLVFFGQLAGLRRRRLAERITDVCEALLLETLRPRKCEELSGGEKRRVHTAIALMARPQLLLLDEPTVGADIETRGALIDLVKLLADEGTAILYSTHYLPEVEALDASVVLLHAGRVIARGSVDDLIARHGVGMLELRFAGPAPTLDSTDLSVEYDGNALRLRTSAPAVAAAQVMNELGDHVDRLESLDVLRPSLDSVFLSLTGHRLRAPESEPDGAS